MAGNHQSEVLAKRPDLRMKTLAYEAKVIDGPQAVDLPQVRICKRSSSRAGWKNQIDAASLALLDSDGKEDISSGPHCGQWVMVQLAEAPMASTRLR